MPQGETRKGWERTGSDLERRFPVALALYAVLAVLAWFTLGKGSIFVGGRAVEVRMLPLVILGGLALRTVLGFHAEKIRRGEGKGGGSKP